MSQLYKQGGLYILGNCNQELGVMGMQEWWIKVVYTGMVSTGVNSEGIKQCEIITILGNRVRAGKMLMSVIDVTQLVFSPGLVRVVHRQGRMTLEDLGGCIVDWSHFGFHQGSLGGGLGGHVNNAEAQQCWRAVRISQHCLKEVMGHNNCCPLEWQDHMPLMCRVMWSPRKWPPSGTVESWQTTPKWHPLPD